MNNLKQMSKEELIEHFVFAVARMQYKPTAVETQDDMYEQREKYETENLSRLSRLEELEKNLERLKISMLSSAEHRSGNFRMIDQEWAMEVQKIIDGK